MSVIAIKAFDKLRRESITPKELRKEHIRRLKDAGKDIPEEFPDDLQARLLMVFAVWLQDPDGVACLYVCSLLDCVSWKPWEPQVYGPSVIARKSR
jgi:hypothetical protein